MSSVEGKTSSGDRYTEDLIDNSHGPYRTLPPRAIRGLFDAREQRQKQTLLWFNTSQGRMLRLCTGKHSALMDSSYRRCVVCNVNNPKNRGSKKTRHYCYKCDAFLCIKTDGWSKSCFDAFHSDRIVLQRVKIPQRRRGASASSS